MIELHLPWLELAIAIPLIGALFVSRQRSPDIARNWCLVFTSLTLAVTSAAWQDFAVLHTPSAEDRWHFMRMLFGREIFVIDEFSAPLLPLTALIYALTAIATLRTKIRRFSFTWSLVSEAITLATFSSRDPWPIIIFQVLGMIPVLLELRARGRSINVFLLHMTTFIALLIVGTILVDRETAAALAENRKPIYSAWIAAPLVVAVLIRSGIAPFHCWITDLFEHATFGTALLYVTPLPCAFVAVRLVLPITPPDGVFRALALLSLITAVYAGGLALVQTEARRFFCYLFLSHSALVLVGLETGGTVGMTGALCVWYSITLSLAGFGLTLRAMEARRGRLSLAEYQGLYDHTPALAVCFLITGLASVGFPGTLGFIGTEMLVDSIVEHYPVTGAAVVIAAALNGIAVVQTYFLLFTGTRHQSSVYLGIGTREKFAVLTLLVIIILGGLFPQPGVASRFAAAKFLMGENKLPGRKTPSREVETVEVVPHP